MQSQVDQVKTKLRPSRRALSRSRTLTPRHSKLTGAAAAVNEGVEVAAQPTPMTFRSEKTGRPV
ncbi:hypothetical protein GLAREA_06408 [Glarea lozoyensis ATCC 20868]|uniref:Uncharacterized protein n=1 Tax=Glarea lozoyensis (strain ATCC 20868 / MF5171) TaxID=1116229 RepID=S3D6L3_GLAL2|nr:uncharacterized protein GLAREA_06408 [Glarea lozoyensis ATCC 20868]EPE33395.1 hypothetical protein GLAREA_06408 [Glarea lozoyensis ATCC 20868]